MSFNRSTTLSDATTLQSNLQDIVNARIRDRPRAISRYNVTRDALKTADKRNSQRFAFDNIDFFVDNRFYDQALQEMTYILAVLNKV